MLLPVYTIQYKHYTVHDVVCCRRRDAQRIINWRISFLGVDKVQYARMLAPVISGDL